MSYSQATQLVALLLHYSMPSLSRKQGLIVSLADINLFADSLMVA
jgi:hypothetical protein